MKKLLLMPIIVMLFCCNLFAAEQPKSQVPINLPEWDERKIVDERLYVWSLAAVADVANDMYTCLTPMSLAPLSKISEYLIESQGVASKVDLIMLCMNQEPMFEEPLSLYTTPECADKEYLVKSVTKYFLGDRTSTGCNIFISNLINANAKYAKFSAPGTYVKKVPLTSGRTAYKVVDVVIADGYFGKNGTINNSVNQADENTGIYMVDNSDNPQRIGTTWTNDSFVRITDGNIRGANTDAYIFLDDDVTDRINKLLQEAAFERSAVGIAYQSRDNGAYDIKKLNNFRRSVFDAATGQSQTYQDANGKPVDRVPENGVVFMGKVASLDALGHIVFGINNRRIAKTGMDFDSQDLGELAAQMLGRESKYTMQFWLIGYGLYDEAQRQSSWQVQQQAAQAGVSIGNPFVNFNMP